MLPGTVLRFSYLALPFLIAAGTSGAQNLPRGAATFLTSSRMVLVPVTVTDHDGRTMVGLQAKDFNVFEGPTPQTIVSFGTEDVPVSVGLVLDTSGSMQRTLGVVKEGAQAFVKTSNPDDEYLLLTVSTLPSAVSEFTNDASELRQDIAVTQPGGLTAYIRYGLYGF